MDGNGRPGSPLSIDRAATGAGILVVVATFFVAYLFRFPFELMFGVPGLVAGLAIAVTHVLDDRRDGGGVVPSSALAGGIGTALALGLVVLVAYYRFAIPDVSLVAWFVSTVAGNVGRFGLTAGINPAAAGSVGALYSWLGTDRDGATPHGPEEGPQAEALRRLKQQYAEGRITEEQFERKLERILESGREHAGQGGTGTWNAASTGESRGSDYATDGSVERDRELE